MIRNIVFAAWIVSIFVLQACQASLDRKIDPLFAAYEGQVPGAAVMVLKSGEVVYQGCFGIADMTSMTAVTPHTNFRLASVSKQFTALAILKLIDQGLINFETPLATIFPELPAFSSEITISQLLHHASGLLDYESLIPDSATVPVHDADVLDLLAAQDSSYFSPGTAYRYSNSGYALLALAVERLSKQSFSDFLSDSIFKPIGMEHSLAYVKGLHSIPYRALGYHIVDGEVMDSDQSMTSSVLGDGGIYSSLHDLKAWNLALDRGHLVSAALTDSMYQTWYEDYACGWRVESFKGRRFHGHGGSTCGFRTGIRRYIDDEISIVILINRRDADIQALIESISEIMFEENAAS